MSTGAKSAVKKWQVGVIVGALLVVVFGLNTVSDLQRQQAEAEREKIEKMRLQAEARARGEIAPHEISGQYAGSDIEDVFVMPDPSGPPDAPVKLEVFVDAKNGCHLINRTFMESLKDDYGQLLRMEWFDMNDPEAAERSDRALIGCAAGLLINDKIEMQVDTATGRKLVAYRGPVNSVDFTEDEVYAGINAELKEKGHTPPEIAQKKAMQLPRAL